MPHQPSRHVLSGGRESHNGACPRAGHGRERFPLSPGATELGDEAGADLLAVCIALFPDLPVETLSVVASFLPTLHQIRYVGVEYAGPPLVSPARWWLGEVLVAVDGASADPELAANVSEIGFREIQTADVPPLLHEALVTFPGRLLDLRLVRPRPVRTHRPGSEVVVVVVVFLLGCCLRRGCFLE